MNYLVYLKSEDNKYYEFPTYKEWKEWYNKIYLKSEHWNDIRKKTLIYFDYKCIICGEKAIQAHHTKMGYLHLWHEIIGKHLFAICNNHHQWINRKILPGGKMREIENNKSVVDIERLRTLL